MRPEQAQWESAAPGKRREGASEFERRGEASASVRRCALMTARTRTMTSSLPSCAMPAAVRSWSKGTDEAHDRGGASRNSATIGATDPARVMVVIRQVSHDQRVVHAGNAPNVARDSVDDRRRRRVSTRVALAEILRPVDAEPA